MMSAQTQTQYSAPEEFTVYKPSHTEKTQINSHKNPNISQSALWSNYPYETTAELSSGEVGNTVIRQQELPPSPESTPKTQRIRKSEVFGTVLSIEDVSAVCEVYLNDSQERTLCIRLPKSLFPDNICYGSPITIAYRQDASGIRRPSVTLRKMSKTERMHQEDREMEALISNF